MQPTPPTHHPAAVPPRSSFGSGAIFGVIALLAVVYLLDHAGKGEAAVAVFSGVNRHISAQDFHGAQCTAVFGSCKIDLREAQIQGKEAILETYAIFGGVDIWIPQDWEVVSRNVVLFGGTNDRSRHSPGGPDTKTLILEGAAIFGGVNVRN